MLSDTIKVQPASDLPDNGGGSGAVVEQGGKAEPAEETGMLLKARAASIVKELDPRAWCS